MKKFTQKEKWIRLGMVLVSICLTLLILESASRFYVYKIKHKGKIFQKDSLLGWKVKSNLHTAWENKGGKMWAIQTDQQGRRTLPNAVTSHQKALILGDSFAFGQGVDISARFDTYIQELGYQVTNLGVMGYGTDQQYLSALPFLGDLHKGDMLVILSYSNDFYDIAAKDHQGRSKPWYELGPDSLQLHKAPRDFHNWLRDKSVLYTFIQQRLSVQPTFSDQEIQQACLIYQKLLKQLQAKLKDKGVEMLVVYHGLALLKNDSLRSLVNQHIDELCQKSDIHCLNLDGEFSYYSKPAYFLPDTHWNSEGHKRAGKLIANKMRQINSSTLGE